MKQDDNTVWLIAGALVAYYLYKRSQAPAPILAPGSSPLQPGASISLSKQPQAQSMANPDPIIDYYAPSPRQSIN